MARDYKSRAARKKAKQRTPVWIWLVIGYVCGSISVGMVWWSLSATGLQGENWIGARPRSLQPAASSSEVEPESAESTEIEPLHYEFYNLLKEQEVVVPDEELEAAPRKPPADRAATPETELAAAVAPVPKSGYLIQVSSTQSARDADGLKARLTLLGLSAQVNKASIKGKTWYRVRVGPFNSAQAVQQARKQLASNGHNTLVIKIRP